MPTTMGSTEEQSTVDVSVVLPVHNGAQWLSECLLAILNQNFRGSIEVSIYNDASTDSTRSIIDLFRERFMQKNMRFTISDNNQSEPKGVGWGRNRAIEQSVGAYLCLQDADDVMSANRIQEQYDRAIECGHMTLIGGQYIREPVDSTPRYTQWCNSLTTSQLTTQGYTSFGPTLILPTWFMSRILYNIYGPFDESGKGTPEDLMFFHKLVKDNVSMSRVDKTLLTYRYHSNNATHSVKEETIWQLRVEAIQDHVISKWSHFTIWNAGKQGRRLYRSLTQENKDKVVAFCDVDEKKLVKRVYTYEESTAKPKPQIPIVHYREATPPLILCVKWGLTNGEFEKNLESLNLVEGKDYYNFS